MMVDGEKNSVTEHEYQPRPWGKDNPYGNVFDVTGRTLSRELDACREADGRTGRFWKVINPNRRNAVGKHPGYKLVAQASPVLLAQAGSSIDRRGGFASKHLWVTPLCGRGTLRYRELSQPARRRRWPARVGAAEPADRE